MASIARSANIATPPAANGVLLAAAFTPYECAYCGSSIASGERWVREKIYEPLNIDEPRYRRFHADLFASEELSCWEKRMLDLELARTAHH